MRHLLIALLLASASTGWAFGEDEDPPEVSLGERLFLETRFAQYYRSHSDGNVNAELSAGDPALDGTETPFGSLPGPFRGQSMNCRSCHLVDEQLDAARGGMRAYGDFARRSPIPSREDGLATAARNSPSLVNASLPRRTSSTFHFDGEFPTLEELVMGTIAGRNYGYVPGERAQAVRQVAEVLRGDDGSGELAQELGGSYREVLSGASTELALPVEFQVDVDAATDEELFEHVAYLISIYVDQLRFAQNVDETFVGSPLDQFLEINALPRQARAGESSDAFARRLRRAVDGRDDFDWVAREEGFEFHDHAFRFGPDELEGLRIFLAAPSMGRSKRRTLRGGVGNCAACHAPPAFSDFLFHNTGVTQDEYDDVHGTGAFRHLFVPGLALRSHHPARWLPATERHPAYQEPFRRPASPADARFTDLGLWNVFGNSDYATAQAPLWSLVLAAEAKRGSRQGGLSGYLRGMSRINPSLLLPGTLAAFKTPGLRDLGHTQPYMHNGQMDTLDDVVRFYQRAAELQRRGKLRNGDEAIGGISLVDDDVPLLVAFLRSLDEDYS
ncbi:MAG: cytochrome c peroxidase [Planctomycetota bacterium]